MGISDDSGTSIESEDGEGEAGSARTGTGEPRPRKDTCSDGSTHQGAAFRGKPVLEKSEDRDHSGSKISKLDVTKLRFRLCRRMGGRRRRKAQHEKRTEQEVAEMGEVPLDFMTDKRGLWDLEYHQGNISL